jgi:hypothetical protein
LRFPHFLSPPPFSYLPNELSHYFFQCFTNHWWYLRIYICGCAMYLTQMSHVTGSSIQNTLRGQFEYRNVAGPLLRIGICDSWGYWGYLEPSCSIVREASGPPGDFEYIKRCGAISENRKSDYWGYWSHLELLMSHVTGTLIQKTLRGQFEYRKRCGAISEDRNL